MRIQILHLPAPPDEFPFALIIDQASTAEAEDPAFRDPRLAESIGARAALAFEGTVELP